MARAVLNGLLGMGAAGSTIQMKIVEELCRMDRPHPDAPDQAKGRMALAELKREATTRQILVDPEQAAAQQRRARAERQQRAEDLRRKRLGKLCTRFFDLLRQEPRTNGERQQRGYALEVILADLFEAYDMDYRRPYRARHEQVDGSFHFRGFTYIVKAKWQTQRPPLTTLRSSSSTSMESWTARVVCSWLWPGSTRTRWTICSRSLGDYATTSCSSTVKT
jgi:hypothetical protein